MIVIKMWEWTKTLLV